MYKNKLNKNQINNGNIKFVSYRGYAKFPDAIVCTLLQWGDGI